ncbi:disintegrin and metalloproteinase domain-containing protein 10-like [Amblyomma americanum]
MSLAARALNHFVRHYEPLSYQPVNITTTARWKRSAVRGQSHLSSVKVSFRAHDREFKLKLVRDRSSFSDDFVLVTNGGIVHAHLDHIYTGYVVGAAGSRVMGALMGGVFTGHIVFSPGDEFYVERASRFFAATSPRPFHSVIYSTRDVTAGGAFCGAQSLRGSRMDATQRQRHKSLLKATRRRRSKRSLLTQARHVSADIGQTPPHGIQGRGWANSSTALLRRASSSEGQSGSPKRVCHLHIGVDHLLFEAVLEDLEGDEVRARDTVIALVASHVAAASEMFGATDFMGVTGISFAVQRVQINDSRACQGQWRHSNSFCREDLDATHLLSTLSRSDHSSYCASYLWTHRAFPGGLLGVAYIADGLGFPGGICEPFQPVVQDGTAVRFSGPMSLNTGIVSFQNHNGRVPQRVSEITFAHELGHNFGSPHDYLPVCVPGGDEGNYIMFANAQTGIGSNNRKFSPCSVEYISVVLDDMLTGEGTRPNCFQEPTGPFCGNLIREGSEECDCGYNLFECRDKCCHSRRHPKHCTLTAGAKCRLGNSALHEQAREEPGKVPGIPSNEACCTENCTFYGPTVLCRPEDDCQHEAFCNGASGECPASNWKPDGTLCNNGTQLCESGDCRQSVCRLYNLQQCYLTGPHHTPDEMCLIACTEGLPGSECLEACKIDRMRALCHKRLEPGAACADLQGYCDSFRRCRFINAEGSLARLHLLRFDISSFIEAALRYWYLTGLGLLVSSAATVAVIRACAVHTPSTNPVLWPNRKISDSIRHPLDFLRDFAGL